METERYYCIGTEVTVMGQKLLVTTSAPFGGVEHYGVKWQQPGEGCHQQGWIPMKLLHLLVGEERPEKL